MSNADCPAGSGGVWLNHTGAVTLFERDDAGTHAKFDGLWVWGSSFTSTGTLRTNGGKIDTIA